MLRRLKKLFRVGLIERLETPKGYYNGYFLGKEYSIVDFGKAMEGHPYPEGLFDGWEAIEIVKNRLDCDKIFRASSLNDLIEKLS